METTLHPTSKSQLQQCKMSKNLLLVDRISELPDEILGSILSFMTMKEAARTSILSQRWKNSWKLITSRLDFEGWNVLREIDGWFLVALRRCTHSFDIHDIHHRVILSQLGNDSEYGLLQQLRSKYIKWVNEILDLHKGATIDNFRVHFDLDYTFRSQIDHWVDFAIEKRVQRLELDLERVDQVTKYCYPFPIQILGDPNISFLRALSLNYVDVTNEVLDSLLLKCPSLEFLCVSNSESLVGQFVFSAPLNLKHLEIAQCPNLKDLKICVLNLRSLTFFGPYSTRLRLENTPNLDALSFGGSYCERVFPIFPKFPPPSHFCSRLQMLTLNIVKEDFFPEVPVLGNLKQLELILRARDSYGILSCTSVLKACPVLYKLTLEFHWFGILKRKREVQREKFLLPKSLNVVELRKFRGGTTDVEMATFLFENAQFLKKICIDTRAPNYVDRHLLNKTILEAKECARQIARQLCPNAKLQIL